MPRPLAALLALLITAASAGAGELYERTVRVLAKDFYDDTFRVERLPQLAEKYAAAADAARTLSEERMVVHQLLSEIPASHLGLLSVTEYRTLMRELQGKPAPTFGFQIVALADGYYVHDTLTGGPADKSGLLVGDRIIRLDHVEPQLNPRLDWRSDDAALPDPPIHRVLGELGETIPVEIERTPGEFLDVPITATQYSALHAAEASATVLQRDSRRIGYVRLWFIHVSGVDDLLHHLLRGKFRDVDALVLDLRGRGGSAEMVGRLLKILRDWHAATGKPLIALTDGNTRSAKELIAYGLRTREIATLVGQRTAGAVLPAMFKPVGRRTVLMYPAFTLGKHSELLEGTGVMPHVVAEAPGPYSAGVDPILEAGLKEAMQRTEGRSADVPARQVITP